jgi:hypothetical protein
VTAISDKTEQEKQEKNARFINKESSDFYR